MSQPLPLDGMLYLKHINHHFGKLYTCIYLEVASYHVVDILLGTFLIHIFIRKIFLLKRKVAPWHSKHITVLTHSRSSLNTLTASNISQELDKAVDEDEQNIITLDVVRVSRRIKLQPNTQHRVLVHAKSHGLITIELNISSRQTF